MNVRKNLKECKKKKSEYTKKNLNSNYPFYIKISNTFKAKKDVYFKSGYLDFSEFQEKKYLNDSDKI